MPIPSDYNEFELLQRIADGDQVAMKVLFDSFHPRLRYLAFDLINDEVQAKDIAQEAFTAFWIKREGFRNSSLGAASNFLFTVVRNKCFDLLKQSKIKAVKHSEIFNEAHNFEDLLEAKIIKEDLLHQVYLEIQQLPPSQRQILQMIFVEGLETYEIAEKLELTPNNVRNLKARSLEKIRSILLKKRLFTLFLFFY